MCALSAMLSPSPDYALPNHSIPLHLQKAILSLPLNQPLRQDMNLRLNEKKVRA